MQSSQCLEADPRPGGGISAPQATHGRGIRCAPFLGPVLVEHDWDGRYAILALCGPLAVSRRAGSSAERCASSRADRAASALGVLAIGSLMVGGDVLAKVKP